jgi:putative nucleotidyltransferase with HDIG domain
MSTRALLEQLRAHDPGSAQHSERVVPYAVALGAEVGGIPLRQLWTAALLHDVGKVAVPTAILNKPGRLSREERELVARHPAAGERMLRRITTDPVVLAGARSHHERWDGGGYPDGLNGAEIPLVARVLAVADTVDAMGAARPYRPALPWDAIEAELLRCSGTQFDPAVVAALQRTRDVLAELHATRPPMATAA